LNGQLEVASLLLVHGAGSGPWVFDGWKNHFPELKVSAADLLEGLNVGRASMSDYAFQVLVASEQLPRPISLCGWSMGGLVALMAAQQTNYSHLVLIEASAPGETQGFDPSIIPRAETFDSERVYGKFPLGVRSRPESQFARDERKRGISIPSIACPTLVISGKDHPIDRGTDLAGFYGAKLEEYPHLNHWQLLSDDSVKDSIRDFLGL
jgi:pimeloyl-ACP methyl ester carboxylesterase